MKFMGGTKKVMELFVKCLTALPNLHTLEIVSLQGAQIIRSFVTALTRREPKLQQVRTLIMPPTAHRLLHYCPNVQDLTCCDWKPDRDFVDSLAAGGPNRVTKFSVLCAAGKDTRLMRDIWPGMVHFPLNIGEANSHKFPQ